MIEKVVNGMHMAEIIDVHERYKKFSSLLLNRPQYIEVNYRQQKRNNTKVLLMPLTAQIFIITFDFISIQLPTLKNEVYILSTLGNHTAGY